MKKMVLTMTIVLGLGTHGVMAKNIVKVKITNIKSTKGKIHIGFYKKGQNFPVHASKHFKTVVKPKIGTMVVSINSLKNAEYAIAVLHDINNNNKLETNFLGMPKEPFGFSKNFKPKFSAPKFNDCSFSLKNQKKSFTINLID